MGLDKFLDKFDAFYDEEPFNYDEAACGKRVQKSLERKCAEELGRRYPARGRRVANYWWNDEIAELRRESHKSRRRAQQTVAAR
jgi:hypothetical protein